MTYRIAFTKSPYPDCGHSIRWITLTYISNFVPLKDLYRLHTKSLEEMGDKLCVVVIVLQGVGHCLYGKNMGAPVKFLRGYCV
jgi:hypothetical protein